MTNHKEGFKDRDNNQHKKPKFQIIVMIAVWAMIIFMILGTVLPAVSQLFEQYF